MTQKQVSGIFKKDTVQVSYDKWSEEVQSNIKEVEKIFRQNPRKDIMQLRSNGLVVKALDSQSRGPVFKTTGWLQG